MLKSLKASKGIFMNDIAAVFIKLFSQITEGIGEVRIWGILPVYLLLYTLAGVIAVRFTGGAAVTKEIRNFRNRPSGFFLYQCMRRFRKMALAVTVVFLIVPAFFAINYRLNVLLSVLGENISSLAGIVIGLTTIVLTVSVVIILFHKNYYLVFSISDVLKSFHFNGCIGVLLSGCLGFCCFALWQMYLEEGTVLFSLVMLALEWCVICCFVSSGLSFFIIYRVMFSNTKVELRQLGRLYRIFRGGEKPDDSQTVSAKHWEEGAVRTNVEYLCAEYISDARSLPIHRVRHLEYLSGEERKRSLKDLYNKALTTFIFIALGVWIISMTVVGIILGKEGTGFLLADTILLAVATLPAYFGYRKGGHGQAQTVFDDALGYEMELENGKRKRIPRMKFRFANRYDRFIRSMNSLAAFFCIGIERGMEPEMTDKAIEIVCDWLSDVKEKHSCIYLPVFAAGYFAYMKGQRPESCAKCYKKLVCNEEAEKKGKRWPDITLTEARQAEEMIKGTSKEELDSMIKGHLCDLTGKNLSSENEPEASFDLYLAWLGSYAEA